MLDELRAGNRRYVEAGGPPRDLVKEPARRVAILTCMDTRLEPLEALGLTTGEAHVIRNAGGRASEDAIRSLVISTQLLGTRTVLVVHHTGCGMAASEEALRRAIAEASGRSVGGLELLAFDDLEQSVRDDVERLRGWPLLPDDLKIAGFVHDVETGELHEVASR
jgi:carbonic anhydrase